MVISLKDFLAREVKPALGCTEPGAVALAVARACEELPDRKDVASIRVIVSSSIYKNGMAVGIPGARGARGNAIAAALGAICGEAKNSLEVLQNSTAEDVSLAERWVQGERVIITCDREKSGVYILASVFTPAHKATCLVEKSHSNIQKVVLDGEICFEATDAKEGHESPEMSLPDTLKETLAIADEMDDADQAFLLEGVRMNLEISESGFTPEETCRTCGECATGSHFGRSVRNLSEKGVFSGDLSLQMRSICASAADARMSGILMPVMSSAGSGNHGITAILPVAILGKSLGADDRKIAHAIAVSHLATSYVKRSLGRLSPVCGCAVAAGAGASAGMTILLGGDADSASKAMSLVLGNLAGMLCDGAKESCSLKVGSGSSEAYFAAQWAMDGEYLGTPQGLVGATIEETVQNVARIQQEGMRSVDHVIIDILDERNRRSVPTF